MPSLFRSSRLQLFSPKIEPSCRYCEYGTPTKDGGAILCARCGVVAPEYFVKMFLLRPHQPGQSADDSSQRLEKEDFEL